MTPSTVISAPEEEPRASGDAAGAPLRALHARLLENAALRRMRGLERRRSQRLEDAAYWLNAAPVAVRKASALREEKSFTPLP
ncbi:hypothetical protein [Brevundimonas sp. LjRoot202]|uniref:hypothetical protein n=1 Tax=Brevundimonas sp. LjRoot202 TaxID=3342281 RepID=UPI003ECD9568